MQVQMTRRPQSLSKRRKGRCSIKIWRSGRTALNTLACVWSAICVGVDHKPGNGATYKPTPRKLIAAIVPIQRTRSDINGNFGISNLLEIQRCWVSWYHGVCSAWHHGDILAHSYVWNMPLFIPCHAIISWLFRLLETKKSKNRHLFRR